MSTATPAVIGTRIVTDFLAAAGADDVPSHYTVCSIGIFNHTTGQLIECDTTALYEAVGAEDDHEITIGTTTLKISRHVFMQRET